MNILEEIIEYKKEEVKSRKAIVKTADLEKRELFSRTVLPLKDFFKDLKRGRNMGAECSGACQCCNGFKLHR